MFAAQNSNEAGQEHHQILEQMSECQKRNRPQFVVEPDMLSAHFLQSTTVIVFSEVEAPLARGLCKCLNVAALSSVSEPV